MTFSMRGKVNGVAIEVGWKDGRLSGRLSGNEFFRAYALAHDGIRVQLSATAPVTERHHLENPFSAMALFRKLVDGGKVEFSGNPPKLPRSSAGDVS